MVETLTLVFVLLDGQCSPSPLCSEKCCMQCQRLFLQVSYMIFSFISSNKLPTMNNNYFPIFSESLMRVYYKELLKSSLKMILDLYLILQMWATTWCRRYYTGRYVFSSLYWCWRGLFICCSNITMFTGWQDVPNGNTNAPLSEGINGAEVERRLSQPVSFLGFQCIISDLCCSNVFSDFLVNLGRDFFSVMNVGIYVHGTFVDTTITVPLFIVLFFSGW